MRSPRLYWPGPCAASALPRLHLGSVRCCAWLRGSRRCAPTGHSRDRRFSWTREVLREIAIGRTNKEIARSLAITLPTVKSHVGAILDKLGVESRTQAALHAVRSRMVSPEELQAA